jgi:hypothetical protein
MDLAATVARYEQALQANKPLMFVLYSAYHWGSLEERDLLREKLFTLVDINKQFNFPELQAPFDMDLRAEVERQNRIAEEVERYDRAFRAMHPDLISVYEAMQHDATLEQTLQHLKNADEYYNFMAEYEIQQALNRLQLNADVTGPASHDH